MASSGAKVFISYSRSDTAFCRDLRERLDSAGVRTWMDVFDIPPGVRWPDAIDRALNTSDIVLGVMTPESLESANVKNEWDWALANGRRLVLLMLRPCRVPFHYISLNYIDGTAGLQDALDELVRSLTASQDVPDVSDASAEPDRVQPCMGCGQTVRSSARFCPNCGNLLISADPDDATVAPSPPVIDALPDVVSEPPDDHSLDVLADDVFVGREQQLDQLRNALQQTLADQAQIALVAGEPGIGKTRLLEIFERIAAHRGAGVFWGRCYEWEGAPAFWPWIQLLRELIQVDDPVRLRDALGSGAADIAQIVPDLRLRMPGLPDAPNIDPEQLRFRLFDSITTYLRNMSRFGPLVLIVDDLHWADTSSLQLLQFVARELGRGRVLILGTYRDVEVGRHHPLAATLGDLSRLPRVQRIPLRGLVRDDVRSLIAQLADSEPTDALTTATFDVTEGNPFFVTEIVRLLVSEARLDGTADSTTWNRFIPEGVREVIGRRLDQLPGECNRTLAIAAVIGRDFSLALLERVSGSSAVDLLDSLESAVRTRVVNETGQVGAYRFSHALIQETLYQELSPARRIRLHQQIGEAIEALYATNLDAHLPELAYHAWQAAPAGDYERAIQFSIRAAGRAMAQLAWEEALAHYERALEAMDLLDAPDLTRKCDVLLAIGGIQNRVGSGTGDIPEARETFRRAVELARQVGSAERLAQAALGMGAANPVWWTAAEERISLLEESLDALGDDDSIVRVQVLTSLASVLMSEANRSTTSAEYAARQQAQWSRAIKLIDDAVAIAQRIGDPGVVGTALQTHLYLRFEPADFPRNIGVIEEALGLACQVEDLDLQIACLESLIFMNLAMGNRSVADRQINEHEVLARSTRTRGDDWRVAAIRAMLALMEGRHADAERLIIEAHRVAGTWSWTWLQQMFDLRRRQGRIANVWQLVQEAREERPWWPYLDLLWALANTDIGDLQQAAVHLERVCVDLLVEMNVKEDHWCWELAQIAEVVAQVGDLRIARTTYGALLPFADLNVEVSSFGTYSGAVSHYLGLLAATLRDWQSATRHFEDALEMNERMRARPFVAETQFAYADTLVKRGEPGDRAKARELVDQALATAGELGMGRLTRLAQPLSDELQGEERG